MSSDKTSAADGLAPRPARPKLSEEIADMLLREIRNRGLSAGTRLPSERELMTQLGVGRSTIREVINGLAILGAVEIRHGQGAFVLDPEATPAISNGIATALSRGVTRDLLEARRIVEIHTTRLAAMRHTSQDLEALETILDGHARAISDQATSVETSVGFHVRLAWSAGNEILAQTVKSVADLLSERGAALERIPGYREWELDDHRSVLAAVAGGDGDQAAERMSTHIDAVVIWYDRAVEVQR